MSERQNSPYDSIAGRWLALVERRQQNFIELCNSGRWQHYYTHAQFLDEMRKVLDLRNRWAELAGLPISGEAELQQIDLPQTNSHPRNSTSKQGEGSHRAVEPQVKPSWWPAGERGRLPASAILAAVAGRF